MSRPKFLVSLVYLVLVCLYTVQKYVLANSKFIFFLMSSRSRLVSRLFNIVFLSLLFLVFFILFFYFIFFYFLFFIFYLFFLFYFFLFFLNSLLITSFELFFSISLCSYIDSDKTRQLEGS